MKRLIVFLIPFVLVVSSSAQALDQPAIGALSIEYPMVYPLTICVVPDGSGAPLTEAFDGTYVQDGTIGIYVGTDYCDPVPGFPPEDIWLIPEGEHWVSCGGTPNWSRLGPDGPTGPDGFTQFSEPLRAGGWTEGPIWVYLNGEAAFDVCGFGDPFVPVQMRFNSPDINGDLRVSVADVALFAEDYYGEYHFRSDFYADTVLSLADVAILAAAMGAECD